jgi:hypothetical protein
MVVCATELYYHILKFTICRIIITYISFSGTEMNSNDNNESDAKDLHENIVSDSTDVNSGVLCSTSTIVAADERQQSNWRQTIDIRVQQLITIVEQSSSSIDDLLRFDNSLCDLWSVLMSARNEIQSRNTSSQVVVEY